MTVVRQHNPARITHDGVVPRRSLNDAPWIDWRASRSLASGVAAELTCADCGCMLFPPAHSPRCSDPAPGISA